MVLGLTQPLTEISTRKFELSHPRCVDQLYNQKNVLTIRLLMSYTGCPRRNVPDFGRVFLMLKYTDVTQNTLFQS